MDCNMPEMDGFQASRIIKDQIHRFSLRDVQIMANSAYPQETYQTKCEEAGMTGYISKPNNIKEIKKELKKVKLI
jgi:CheY-like chemotaxis protein